MLKQFVFLIFVSIFLASCASSSSSDYKSPALNYDLVISQKRRELPRKEFVEWLTSERRTLSAKAEGIEGSLYSTSARGSYQEVSNNPTSGASGTENFNVQMTNLELKRLQQQLDQVRRDIRTIDAVMSSLQ